MKKNLISLITFGLLSVSPLMADLNSYGIPEHIQNGNILHCFDWTFTDIQAELPAIAEAGFGAVQVSPVQGNAALNAEWFYAYMPYDFAFKANGNGTADQLKSLCAEAKKYGIKVIVDVVANHINVASGYRDPWWDENGRERNNGGINYNDRYSITHNNLGGYHDVNSEDPEVQQRAKAFVESLKEMGVSGIRWDAAKHIGLPSEDCAFWEEVTSVPDMYHYGEILDGPGGDKYKLLAEYAKYMTVTDTEYSDWTRSGGGAPGGHGSWTANGISDKRVLYWGESHDTYSNDNGATTFTNQTAIDRAWAIGACRQFATSLYFSRPSATSQNSIRMGQKGSTHFKDKEVAEVNKFRNRMIGREEYYSMSNGVASLTRKDGGAVIVNANGAGTVSVANGGAYCPAGTYTDKVSGNQFTVTATTISGTTGSTGIAVLYNDDVEALPEPDPNEDIDSDVTGPQEPETTPDTFYLIGSNLPGTGASWGDTPGTGIQMTKNGDVFTVTGVKMDAPTANGNYFRFSVTMSDLWSGMTLQYGPSSGNVSVKPGDTGIAVTFNPGDNCYTIDPGTYDITVDFSTKTMSITGTSEEVEQPVLPEITTLYLMGNNSVTGGWAANKGASMTRSGNVFTIDATITDAGGGAGYFSFAQQLSTSDDWDENGGCNDGYRFGAPSKDYPAEIGDYAITTYTPNVNASSCQAWMITPGNYKLSVNLATMTLTIAEGEGGGGGNDDPVTPGDMADLYIIGNLPIGSWNPSQGYKADIESEYYVFRNITITNGNAGNGYFSFCRQLSSGTNWDEAGGCNSGDRFGPASKDLAITAGTMEAPVTKYQANVNASACTSWMITAGEYDFVLNKDVNQLSVYEGGKAPNFATGIDNIDATPLYSVSAVAGNITVTGLNGQNVVIAGLNGQLYYNARANDTVNVYVGQGIFVVNVDGNSVKLLVK